MHMYPMIIYMCSYIYISICNRIINRYHNGTTCCVMVGRPEGKTHTYVAKNIWVWSEVCQKKGVYVIFQ